MVVISQCIDCGMTYACNINGLRHECKNCTGEDCIINHNQYIISHGFCQYHLDKHMEKFKQRRLK